MQYKHLYFLLLGLCLSNSICSQNILLQIQNDTAYLDELFGIAHAHAFIQNPTSDSIYVDVIRDPYEHPDGWLNAMCVGDICYFSHIDSVRVGVGPGEEIEFRSGFTLMSENSLSTVEAPYVFRAVESGETITFPTFGHNLLLTTATTEENTSASFKLFPNPASENITIDLSTPIETLQIFDCLGRLVFQDHTGNTFLNISTMESGVYFLIVETHSGRLKQAFVKN